MREMNVWQSALRQLEQTKNLEIINNVSLIGSDYGNDVIFNNLGVLQESIGQLNLAKIFFLKSLGENIFNYQVWNNFLSVNNSSVGLENGSVLYTCLYLLQSNFAIKIFFLAFLIWTFVCLFEYLAYSNSMRKMLKNVSITSLALGLMYFINFQNIFVTSKSNLKIYEGPSIIYKTDSQVDVGLKLIKLKKNNGFIKVYRFNSKLKSFWVKQAGIINL